jgi:hypothetical protein
LLRSELRLQREFRRRGFTTLAEYVRNVIVRGGYRLIPWWLRRAVYRPIVAHYTEHPAGTPGPGDTGGPGPDSAERSEPTLPVGQ